MDTEERRDFPRQVVPIKVRVELFPLGLNNPIPPLVGRVVDLSVGGIGILLREPIAPAILHSHWIACFSLPSGADGRSHPLAMYCVVVHCARLSRGYVYGLKFEDTEHPSQVDQRERLEEYLLSEPDYCACAAG